MIIQCINCGVKYNIDESKIKPPGKKVKCSKCGELFTVEKEAKTEAEQTSPQTQPEKESHQSDFFKSSTVQDKTIGLNTKVLDDISKGKDSESESAEKSTDDEVSLYIDDSNDESIVDHKEDKEIESEIEHKILDKKGIGQDDISQSGNAEENQDLNLTPGSDESQKEKDSDTELTDISTDDQVSQNTDFSDEGSEAKEKVEDELALNPQEEKVESQKSETEESINKNDKVSDEEALTIETSFEEVAAFDKNEEPLTDERGDTEENIELEGKDIVDWESLEVDNIEERVGIANRKGLTDSDAETPEGDLEVDDSRKKIKEERKRREEQNPFRTPSLSPELSDTASSYHRISEAVIDDDSSMEVASTNSGNQKFYTSQFSGSKKKRSFLSRFFVNLTIVVVLAILFTAAFFSLITFGVIPKEKIGKYTSLVTKYLPVLEDENERRLKMISVKDISGKWINSRNGYLFVVYGEVINNSNKSVSYIKLRSKYFSAGKDLYMQEFYSGNTLTLKELKNGSVSSLEKKLGNKSGDVDFDDVDSFAGRNFNIEPGQSVPFYTFYLSKRKMLGLKYDIDVVDFESGNI